MRSDLAANSGRRDASVVSPKLSPIFRPWSGHELYLNLGRGFHSNRIPGAVEGVASLALALDHLGPWIGALQWRWFGPRPLTEDNSVRSKASAMANARVGYRLSPQARLELEVFNLTDRKVSVIDYYYTSRLPGEPA